MCAAHGSPCRLAGLTLPARDVAAIRGGATWNAVGELANFLLMRAQFRYPASLFSETFDR